MDVRAGRQSGQRAALTREVGRPGRRRVGRERDNMLLVEESADGTINERASVGDGRRRVRDRGRRRKISRRRVLVGEDLEAQWVRKYVQECKIQARTP